MRRIGTGQVEQRESRENRFRTAGMSCADMCNEKDCDINIEKGITMKSRPEFSVQKLSDEDVKKLKSDYYLMNDDRMLPLPDAEIGILSFSGWHTYRCSGESQTHPLMWSYEWPCLIIANVARDLGIPIVAWSGMGQNKPMFFQWSMASKILAAVACADYAIDKWYKGLTWWQKFAIEGVQPAWGDPVTMQTLREVKIILSQ